MKRLVSIILCLALFLAVIPFTAFAASDIDYGAIAKSEYTAFSKSLAKSDVSSSALTTMVSHAISGRGKDLNAGESSPVTASLLNSGTYTEGIVAALTKFLESGEDSLSLTGTLYFYQSNYKYTFRENGKTYVSAVPSSTNDYDAAMCLVVGGASTTLDIAQTSESADSVTYHVDICITDIFNFDGDYSGWEDAGFEISLTWAGALAAKLGLVEEFSWSASADFDLTVPKAASEPEVPAHSHSYKTTVTDPTCTEDGYTTYTCDCGDSYTDDEVKAIGHKYNTVVTPNTCTEDGYTTYTCACGDSYIGDEVKASGHKYNAAVTAPTCTAGGYTTYTCACGNSYIGDEVGVIPHSYTANVTAPTCTEPGYTTYTCNCGYSYIANEVSATGHSYSTVVTPPTETTAGYTTYTCECGYSYVGDEVSENGHSYTANVTAPTCTEDGYTTYTCACGDSYVADEVKATGHSYNTVVTAPTCTEDGYTTYTCACGDSYVTDEVKAAGHKNNAVVTAPTCTEDGYTT